MADYDVIVIGGGIGGLTVGALTAKDGRKTLVLEQNERIGGFCSTFEHQGYHFDVGTSLIEMEDVFDRFFKRMNTTLAKEVDLVPLDPIYTYVLKDGTEVHYPVLKEAMAEEMKKLSPDDAKSWFKYAEDMQGFIDVAIPAFFFSPMLGFGDLIGMFAKNPKLLKYLPLFGKSYQTVLEKYFKDPRVREVLCFQAIYTGLPPALAPGVMSMLPWCERTGFFYCKGGLIAIPKAIERLGKKEGMEIRTGVLVKKVIVKDGRACGVITGDGTEITANVVVSDINAKTLYMDLIGLEHLGPMARSGVKSLEISASALMLFMGLDAAPPLKSHHTVPAVPVEDLNDLYLKYLGNGQLPPKQVGLISWKTLSDPDLAPKGHHTVVLTLCGPYHLAQGDWDKVKGPLAEEYVDYFDRYYMPGIKDHVKVAMLGTPKDFERDLLAPKGGIYMFSQEITHSTLFRPSAKSRSIKGLYLVGSSTHPGGGVPPVIGSAMIGADLIRKYE
jgi:phytoene desaturase